MMDSKLEAHTKLLEYARVGKLDSITSEHAADYAAYLQTKGWQPSSVNSSLRVLRRALRLAEEWGITPSAPKIKLLRGEHHRDRVVLPEEEARYLAAAGHSWPILQRC